MYKYIYGMKIKPQIIDYESILNLQNQFTGTAYKCQSPLRKKIH